jgi:hypothetical protein
MLLLFNNVLPLQRFSHSNGYESHLWNLCSSCILGLEYRAGLHLRKEGFKPLYSVGRP